MAKLVNAPDLKSVGLIILASSILAGATISKAKDISISYTVPSTQKACGDSVDSPDPERMGTIRYTLVRIPQGDSLHATKNVAGLEGQTDRIDSVVDSTVHYVEHILQSVDLAGNEGCIKMHYLQAVPPDTSTFVPARIEAQFWDKAFTTYQRSEYPLTVDYDSTGADYGVRFLGLLEVPSGGARIYIMHDDAARGYVDGAWITTQPSCNTNINIQSMDVNAGFRNIRVDFINCGSPAVCKLEWDSPSIPRQVIPQEAWK